MKKMMKRIGAVLLAVAMMAALGVTGAFAAKTTQHTITISNPDQYVTHSYEAYQVFKGNLDGKQEKLSDIEWGSGVNGASLLQALKDSQDPNLYKDVNGTSTNVFAACTTPADVAKVINENFQSTNGVSAAGVSDNSGAIDVIGTIIAQNLTSTKSTFTPGDGGKTYTATVTGDGYYFIKDTTTNLTGQTGSDTKSKHLLSVIKDTTIIAKDTGSTPKKEIDKGNNVRVKKDTPAVGDTETFRVEIPVPDTRKYVDHFVFEMNDSLPKGMTFMGITSIMIDTTDVTAANYTLTVAPNGSNTYAAYTAPADATAAVTAAGGQKIKITFKDFKKFVEDNNLDHKTLVVTYTAVVNNKADFTPTGNENEVYFVYSNDPNHVYTGDNPEEPMGETPHDKTTSFLTNIEIYKEDDQNPAKPLAGATFEIKSNSYNLALVTGEKFEPLNGYTLKEGETRVGNDVYYKLTDNTYTTEAPTTSTANSYVTPQTQYQKISYTKYVTTPEAGDPQTITAISGENGKINLEGLKPGTYTIQETIAPTGFNNDNTVYTIALKWDETEGKIVLDTAHCDPADKITFENSTATAKITIQNKSGTTLPSTGGIGTYVFTIAGVAIMAVAAGLLVIRHKKKAE